MKPFAFILLAASVPFSSTSAELLTGYDFTADVNPSKLAPGVTASPVTGIGAMTRASTGAAGDTQGISASGIRFGSSNKGSLGKNNIKLIGGDLSDAIANDNYLTFTITADVPGTLKISKLSFHTAQAGEGAASHYNVLAKANGSSSWIWKASHALTSDQHTQVNHLQTKWHPTSIDMSKHPFFQNVDTMEFRIYFWGGSGGVKASRIGIDNIVVEGAVAQPKTSNSSSLISFGGITLTLQDKKP